MLREAELGGDHLVLEAPRHQLQYLLLARGEVGQPDRRGAGRRRRTDLLGIGLQQRGREIVAAQQQQLDHAQPHVELDVHRQHGAHQPVVQDARQLERRVGIVGHHDGPHGHGMPAHQFRGRCLHLLQESGVDQHQRDRMGELGEGRLHRGHSFDRDPGIFACQGPQQAFRNGIGRRDDQDRALGLARPGRMAFRPCRFCSGKQADPLSFTGPAQSCGAGCRSRNQHISAAPGIATEQ